MVAVKQYICKLMAAALPCSPAAAAYHAAHRGDGRKHALQPKDCSIQKGVRRSAYGATKTLHLLIALLVSAFREAELEPGISSMGRRAAALEALAACLAANDA